MQYFGKNNQVKTINFVKSAQYFQVSIICIGIEVANKASASQ
jgi:hypothetical protein